MIPEPFDWIVSASCFQVLRGNAEWFQIVQPSLRPWIVLIDLMLKGTKPGQVYVKREDVGRELWEEFNEMIESFRVTVSRPELGASVCVTLDEEHVGDLWGGFADPERSRAWQEDTIVNVYSSTKGLAAACANKSLEPGQLRSVAFPCAPFPAFTP